MKIKKEKDIKLENYKNIANNFYKIENTNNNYYIFCNDINQALSTINSKEGLKEINIINMNNSLSSKPIVFNNYKRKSGLVKRKKE